MVTAAAQRFAYGEARRKQKFLFGQSLFNFDHAGRSLAVAHDLAAAHGHSAKVPAHVSKARFEEH